MKNIKKGLQNFLGLRDDERISEIREREQRRIEEAKARSLEKKIDKTQTNMSYEEQLEQIKKLSLFEHKKKMKENSNNSNMEKKSEPKIDPKNENKKVEEELKKSKIPQNNIFKDMDIKLKKNREKRKKFTGFFNDEYCQFIFKNENVMVGDVLIIFKLKSKSVALTIKICNIERVNHFASDSRKIFMVKETNGKSDFKFIFDPREGEIFNKVLTDLMDDY